MRFLVLPILIFFMSCSSSQKEIGTKIRTSKSLAITEVEPNKWTSITRQNLEHLFQIYDLTPYIFTFKVLIESKIVPESHPILKLNTRYAEEPNKLLSLFLHEQLHWWAELRKSDFDKAIAELKVLFPKLPAHGLAKDVNLNYLHLLICYLEYEASLHLMGKKEANKILKDLIYKDKVYPWIYKQVYLKFKSIKLIVEKYHLSPRASS